MEGEVQSRVGTGRGRLLDEFDVYFARAALDESFIHDNDDDSGLTGNCFGGSPRPLMTGSGSQTKTTSIPRRSVSCKYPSRKKSVSPKRDSPLGSPIIGSQSARVGDSAGLCAPLLGVWSNRSSSAPQSRSSSWKKMKRPPSFRNVATDPKSHYHHHHHHHHHHRSGSGGSPDPDHIENLEETIIDRLHQLKQMKDADCCVVRSFNTSPKGNIVNKFDMFKRIGDQLSSPPASPLHNTTTATYTTLKSPDQNPINETGNGIASFVRRGPDDVCKVAVIGQSHVGKTALIQQFMTSHYMAAVGTSFDDELDKTVCVILNGEETMINFIDSGTPTKQEYLSRSDVDAYILVYSITALTSFRYACEVLCDIRCEDFGGSRLQPIIILVANKSDLVRTKQVSEAEAKYVCRCLDCKYIEVSASLNHRVDDLLVGIVRQIKRNRREEQIQRQQRGNDVTDARADAGKRRCLKGAKDILKELFRGDLCIPPSSSCDNLYEL